MKTYYVKTFGCQMNEADSEKIAGYYSRHGFSPAKKIQEADEIIINTCSVRQSAEDRVLGLVNNLTKKNKKNEQKIIVTGCMLRYPLKWLKEKMPGVDDFLKIKELSLNTLASRDDPHHSWVPIIEGCDNFCTYCVVPYARGRERSRPLREIICEVKELTKRGYKEITLLGQNVNSYGKDLKILKNKSKTPFALLLTTLNEIYGLDKIKFMTSNPWDLSNDIIEAMKLPKVDRYLHLPVQSGDDEILRRMNRKYTAKQYLDLVKKIRRKIPEIKIGTDIIVGFPGETEKEFQNTVDLCRKAQFSLAYIARYSPRPQTAAFRLKDDVPLKEKKRRWQILEKIINRNF